MDKETIELLKKLDRYDLYGCLFSFIPTAIWFLIVIFLADDPRLLDGIDSDSTLGGILVVAGVLSIPVIYFTSWGLFANTLRSRNKKKDAHNPRTSFYCKYPVPISRP